MSDYFFKNKTDSKMTYIYAKRKIVEKTTNFPKKQQHALKNTNIFG